MEELNLTPVEEEVIEAAPVVEEVPQEPEYVEVVDVQFRPGQKVYFFDPDGMDIQQYDHLIIDTARGPEYGICSGGNHRVPAKDVVQPLRQVLRFATEADEKQMIEMRNKEKKAYQVCLQKIADHGLDMQLVSAEYSFDGSKILFFFTADERVDFRELVKNLASIFHTRIELRQIGVRDKAKMVGGLGICGRPFCCASFLEEFQPVSIKMAKTQNLSLNPTKISGTCGRLMCCLKYEQEAYEDLIKTAPKADSFVDTPDGRGTVVDVNLLRQSVKVRMENSPETVGCYKNCDICVLRSGKAKKNDPPIPADLAPISGSGNAPRKTEEKQEESAFLEPVKFRYSTESLVEEQPIAAAPAQEPREEPRQRRNKPNRPKKPRTEDQGEKAEKAEKPEKPEKAPRPPRKPRPERREDQEELPEQLKTEAVKEKIHRRKPYYHNRRRRPKGDGGAPAGE
ncbi:MAG: stage 0 sporulation family protein [Oscillospiraceae bacterium]|nr:stage 0 sporulation family protein [Oscillospiraceae bacterium]